jgi:hypothetical protein
MGKNIFKKTSALSVILIFVISGGIPALGYDRDTSLTFGPDVKYITMKLNFSYPEVVPCGDYLVVRVKESDINRMDPGKPVLPANLSIFEFPLGTKIIDVEYDHSVPEIINLTKKLAFGFVPLTDNMQEYSTKEIMDVSVYENSDPYPSDWVSYHAGGGLSNGEHTTFLVIRVYPVIYFPTEDQLQFIENITINISYSEPVEPIVEDTNICDLLVLAPKTFMKNIQPLVCHKNHLGVKTKLVSLDDVYDRIWYGRDNAEKIKLFIKEAIEESDIKYVLLVGGLKGQTSIWNLPVRYSHVVPPEEQEYPEQSFISDLYYADIYDSEGRFSSWDSNDDGIFAAWNETYKEEMDIYPDIYLGRLPCMSVFEVKTMVDKIINYEEKKCDDSWFKKLILVAGDSYNDTHHFNEGELISEKAIELMPEFTPVKVYASEQDINRKTVNKAMNQGAGFAYFCGHGNPASWNTHFPPNGTKWTTGYKLQDMISLCNGQKLPIVVVGGCHNGQFDISMWNILKGVRENGLSYFRLKPKAGEFWYNLWVPNCWSWWLTSKMGGGAIASISNTGLGTHGDGDADNNSIADYLEVLDGWLELRFLELYGTENMDILGQNHGVAITGYIHRFLGNDAKMDVKMVQQWVLFGDPSLKIGGYE